jgi:RimJ/RimL family protein N-acetyltransferase
VPDRPTQASNRYPHEWERDAVLPDGGRVHLRPVRPDDADAILRFHAGLNDESIYLRFFSPLRRLPPSLLHRFTHVDYDRRMVVLVLLGDVVIAMASYDRDATGAAAEIAVAVEEDHQKRGVATLLLEHLVAIARSHGVHSFTANTLPHNRPVLAVFQNAGFHVETTLDHGTVHVRFSIDPE